MRGCTRLAILVIALFSLGGPRAAAPGPPPSPRFESLTIEDGLSQATVHGLHVGRRGFLWVATQDGLNRYDGLRFEVLRPEAGKLADGWVTDVTEGPEGNLWVATWRGGISRIDAASGAVTTFRAGEPSGLSIDRVWRLLVDREGRLWAGTIDGGLCVSERADGRFSCLRHDPADARSLPHDRVRALAEDRRGRLWVGTSGGGLAVVNPRTRRLDVPPLSGARGALGDAHVWALLADGDGTLWVGTLGEGLFAVEEGGARARRVSGRPELPSPRVVDLARDGSGRLWVATWGGGLARLDPADERVVAYRHDPTDPESLPTDDLLRLRVDDGLVWIGTLGRGLVKFDPDPLFLHVKKRAEDPGSLRHDDVSALLEDASGTLWVGTRGGGLHALPAGASRFRHYAHDPEQRSSLPHDNVTSLAEVPGGTLWIGTEGGGLARLAPGRERFEVFRARLEDPLSLPSDIVGTLLVDRGGDLWVGTIGGGLARWRPELRAFERFRHDPQDPESLPSDHVLALAEGPDGTLFVGTQDGGLASMPAGGGPVNRFGGREGLVPDDVLAIHAAAAELVWLGTPRGLLRVDLASRRSERRGARQGLPSDIVYGILPDDRGQLWLSTNAGLCALSPATGRLRGFSLADGLQSTEFNQGAYARAADGALFFGGINGYNVVRPASIEERRGEPPPVVITGVELQGESVAGQPFGRLPETLRLGPDDTYVEIEFAALDYRDPRNNRYAYRLEGLDDGWIDAGRRRHARYTTLPGGEYVFRVRAATSSGTWSEEGARLRVVVVPAFWKRGWVQGLAVALLVAGVAAGHRVRTRVVKTRSERLEGLVSERTAELERANQRLEREIESRREAEEQLRAAHEQLETRVAERTAELERANEQLTGEISDRERAEAARRRLEERLDVAQRMEVLGRLAGGMAHDFNNLLSPILTYTDLLLKETDGGDARRRDLLEIRHATDAARRLTRQLLAFGRRQRLERRVVTLDEVLLERRTMLGAALREEIALRMELGGEGVRVDADVGQLEQVLMNLVINAQDAIDGRGTIVVRSGRRRTAPSGTEAVLEVEDDGNGIEASVLEHIFEPFFTTKEAGKGTGLGLASVHGVVKQHGGTIEVSSEAGQGTRFVVRLPATEDALSRALEAHDAREDAAGEGTVLLVEDDESVRRATERVLAKAGFRVVTAPDGRRALELFEQAGGRVDVLLSDLVMPGMDGGELLRRLHARAPKLPVVFMTGWSSLPPSVGGEARAVLRKPVSPATLVDTLRRALAGAG